jgi:hypothetical protein
VAVFGCPGTTVIARMSTTSQMTAGHAGSVLSGT